MRAARAAIAAAILLCAARARAHDETVSTSDVRVDGGTLVWRVDVGTAGLGKAVKLPPEADMDERDLARAAGAIGAYLARGLRVELDGRETAAEIGPVEARYEPYLASGRPYIARVVAELRYRAPRPIDRVRARVAFFSDLTAQHRAVVVARFGNDVRQYVRLGVAEIELARATAAAGRLSVLREFLVWGTEHIFIGYDHIAFLLALLLVASGWRELLKIVTSFTVAHSITLLLAATDVLRVPSRFTEAAIAASIVYVAAENLWLPRPGHRWRLTFAFGLVHGLGFATELRQRLAEMGGSVVLPVVSFNLGVELGQIAIVSVAFPIILLLRRGADADATERRRRRVVRAGSVPILALGVTWLILRVL